MLKEGESFCDNTVKNTFALVVVAESCTVIVAPLTLGVASSAVFTYFRVFMAASYSAVLAKPVEKIFTDKFTSLSTRGLSG